MGTFLKCIVAVTSSIGLVTCGEECYNALFRTDAFLLCAALDPNLVTTVSQAPREVALELMCTPNGRRFAKCIWPLIDNCQRVLDIYNLDAMATMFNESWFTSDEMIDLSCEMEKDGCKDVQTCIDVVAPTRKKRGEAQQTNNFVSFQTEAVAVCTEGSPANTMLMCMDDKLQFCDQAHVPKIERFIQQIASSLPVEEIPGMSSVSKSIKFFQEQCQKIPADFSTTICIVSQTEDLNQCMTNITNTFPDLDNCGVKPMSDKCVLAYIKPTCGEDIADFYTGNTDFIFKKIPDVCNRSADPYVAISIVMFVPLLATLVY